MLLVACFIYITVIDTCHSEDTSSVNTEESKDIIYLACINAVGFCQNNGTCYESFNGPIVIFCRCKDPFFGDRCQKEDTKECDQILFGVGILAGIAIIVAVGSTCQLYLKSGDIKQAKTFYRRLERQSQGNNSRNSTDMLSGKPEHELQYIKHNAIDKEESDTNFSASDLDSMKQNIDIEKQLQSSSSLPSLSKSEITENKNTIGVENNSYANESVFVHMEQEEKTSNNVNIENPLPAKGEQDNENNEQKWNSIVTHADNSTIPQIVVTEDKKNFATPDEINDIENRKHFDLSSVIENKDESNTAPIASLDLDDSTDDTKSHFKQLQNEGKIDRNHSRIPERVSQTQNKDISERGQISSSIKIRESNYKMNNDGLSSTQNNAIPDRGQKSPLTRNRNRSRNQSSNKQRTLPRHSSIRSLDDMIDHPSNDIYAHSVHNSMETLTTNDNCFRPDNQYFEYPVHNVNGRTSRDKRKVLEIPVSYTIDNSGNISPTFHPYIPNNRNQQRRSYSVRSNSSHRPRLNSSNVKYMSMNTHLSNRRRSECLNGSAPSSSYDNRPKGIWARSTDDLDKLSRYSIY